MVCISSECLLSGSQIQPSNNWSTRTLWCYMIAVTIFSPSALLFFIQTPLCHFCSFLEPLSLSILTREFGRQFCSRVFKQHERRNKFRIHVNEQCCNSQEQSLSPSFALSLGKTKMQQHNSEKNKRPGKQCEQIFIFHTWTISLWKHWKNTGPALKHYVML